MPDLATDELLAVIGDLSFARDLDRVADVVRRAARRLTRADGVSFVLKEGEQCYYADEDAIAPLWKGRRFPLDDCVSGWVMRHGEPAAIRDVYADSRVPHEAYRPTFVKSLLMVPVRPEEAIAAIGAYWATEHEPTADERHVLEVLANAAALALENVRLWADLERAVERERRARLDADAAKNRAEEANRLKDEFLDTVSHELRTPLNVMQGWLWQLRQPGLPRERFAKALDTLERNTALQARLVDDLLDVSRAIGGRLTIDPRLVDLAGVCQTVVEAARPAADAKGVQLEFRDDGAAPLLVWGDPERLQQILWNVVANGIKFTPAGGRVEMAAGRSGSKAVVSVRDTGIGIPAEFLPHLFDEFRQADGSQTRQHGGLGIGLTIVHHLVRLHGGTVGVHSAGRDLGTTIRIELPVPVVRSEPGEWLTRRVGAPRPASVSLAGVTLLVIDDEPDAREALQQLLEQYGATVHCAASAEDALALLEHVTPTVVVADLSMRGTDGFAFARELRRRSNATVPAAALTALSGAEYERLAAEAGFALFLQKPIPPDELTRKLAELAGQSGRRVH
jgi:signal transduction histidine kinase/CheY-like chemotaxis protein